MISEKWGGTASMWLRSASQAILEAVSEYGESFTSILKT